MKTRKVIVRVICDLPEDVSVGDWKGDIEIAINKQRLDSLYGSSTFNDSLQIKSSYTPRSS